MKNFYNTIIFSSLCLVFNIGYSQSAKVDSAGKTPTDSLAKAIIDSALKSDKKSSFKINLNYISNNVFFGRADTVSTPTLIPEIKYTFKNGVFVSANASYIPNRKTNKLDGENITLGYDHDFSEDLSAGISFEKLFYAANSTQIGSSVSSTISANISYDIADIISPTLSADYDLIKNGFSNDIIINLGIAHDFSKKACLAQKIFW